MKASVPGSYADCFAAALAVKKKFKLIAGNREFGQLAKETKVRRIR